MIFDPDDFRDDPYSAGLNQIGHMVFGGALAVLFGWWAGLIVIAWEAYQLRYRGALRSDYWADWAFWTFGIACVAHWWFLPAVVMLGGAWMAVTHARR
ncbi:MAG: hypothetical protein E6R03_06455 [Hyphomicrobiaceae bacterium]|nr:MAG: hypothetical protein E6R03_06455 [Hyphomicrobiaceae bacterium]